MPRQREVQRHEQRRARHSDPRDSPQRRLAACERHGAAHRTAEQRAKECRPSTILAGAERRRAERTVLRRDEQHEHREERERDEPPRHTPGTRVARSEVLLQPGGQQDRQRREARQHVGRELAARRREKQKRQRGPNDQVRNEVAIAAAASQSNYRCRQQQYPRPTG